MKQINTNRQLQRKRRGITILEVITAILVAVIGVFGVCAIIPFAVRQTEIGLNQEDSINAARNIQQRFETMGLKASDRWFFGPTTGGSAPAVGNRPGFGIDPDIRVYCIDPIGVAQYADRGVDFTDYGRFPRVPATFAFPADFPRLIFNHDPVTRLKVGAANPGIPRITFLDRGNAVYNRALASMTFGYENDLVYKNTNQRAEAPLPQYFRDSGVDYKRMTRGDVTTMCFIVGKGESSGEYTMYTVVFRKRQLDPNATSGFDRIFQVVGTPSAPATQPSGTYYGGGDFTVTELTTPDKEADRIGRNRWVMMLNADESNTGATLDGTVRSLQFFRVVESYEVGAAKTLTLQGGDFDFTNTTTPPQDLQTYIIYMPDVIAVYENTFRFESLSEWN